MTPGQSPFTGTFRSAESLSALVGHSQQGTWSLDIQDTTFGDSGTLKSWGADLSPATCAAKPVASFSATPNPVSPGGTVDFDASESVDPIGTITTYEWDLDGDGTFETDTGSTPTVSHTYPVRASVPVGLKITDDQAATDVTTRTIAVTDGPTAAFTATPLAPVSGTPVELDGSASSDVDGTVVHYEWDLDGNGTFETDSGTDATITHSFPNPGTINVKLRVTDDNGATAVASQDVVVANRPPTASFTRPTPAISGSPAAFDASGSSDADGTIVDHDWDLDGNGTYETDTGPVATVQRTYTGAQTLTIGLRVTDDLGLTATTTMPLQVTGPPTAAIAIVGPSTVKPNQSVTFDASASSDADGTIVKYEWDFDGNGTFETDGGDKAHRVAQLPARHLPGRGARHRQCRRQGDRDGHPQRRQRPSGRLARRPCRRRDHGCARDPRRHGVQRLRRHDRRLRLGPGRQRHLRDDDRVDRHRVLRLPQRRHGHRPRARHRRQRRDRGEGRDAHDRRRADDRRRHRRQRAAPAARPAAPGPGAGADGGTIPGTVTGTGPGSGPDGGPDGFGPGGTFSAGLVGAPIQALKLARTRGVGVTCKADRRATCDVILELPGTEAKRLKLVKVKKGKKAKAIKVGAAKVTAGPGAGTKMVLRLNARLKRALKKTRRVQLVLRGTATDGAGGKIALARIVLLRR